MTNMTDTNYQLEHSAPAGTKMYWIHRMTPKQGVSGALDQVALVSVNNDNQATVHLVPIDGNVAHFLHEQQIDLSTVRTVARVGLDETNGTPSVKQHITFLPAQQCIQADKRVIAHHFYKHHLARMAKLTGKIR